MLWVLSSNIVLRTAAARAWAAHMKMLMSKQLGCSPFLLARIAFILQAPAHQLLRLGEGE
jgi:hypothetical protein